LAERAWRPLLSGRGKNTLGTVLTLSSASIILSFHPFSGVACHNACQESRAIVWVREQFSLLFLLLSNVVSLAFHIAFSPPHYLWSCKNKYIPSPHHRLPGSGGSRFGERDEGPEGGGGRGGEACRGQSNTNPLTAFRARPHPVVVYSTHSFALGSYRRNSRIRGYLPAIKKAPKHQKRQIPGSCISR